MLLYYGKKSHKAILLKISDVSLTTGGAGQDE